MEFSPHTAREALLAIAAEIKTNDMIPRGVVESNVLQMVREGLGLTGLENFELSDHLADRLAEAHRLLREVLDMAFEPPGADAELIAKQIPAALALPPDLEAMVERRIGPR